MLLRTEHFWHFFQDFLTVFLRFIRQSYGYNIKFEAGEKISNSKILELLMAELASHYNRKWKLGEG